jgi:hypothetical protein
MLKGKQKKLDVNKDGKISGKDFAVLKAEKAKGRGMGLQDEQLPPGKMVKAESGKMITEAEAPDLGGMMGAEAAGDIEGSINPYLKNKRPLPMLRDSAIERIASRSRPLPMLEEPQQFKKEKPITPKERREKDIAKRAQKKMGGGMMMQDSMGYKKGGAVRGGRKEIKGLRPAKMF